VKEKGDTKQDANAQKINVNGRATTSTEENHREYECPKATNANGFYI
jgi:hypothetical protein